MTILNELLGGDLRSIGKAEEIVLEILNNPALFDEIYHGMKHDNPLVRMRSADIIEKVSKMHPEYLVPYKEELIKEISEIPQQEVRWHIALMFSYLDLSDIEKAQVIEKLLYWLENSKSKIVIVNSLQTLAHIASQDNKYRTNIKHILEEAIEKGSPSVEARAKKLINLL